MVSTKYFETMRTQIVRQYSFTRDDLLRTLMPEQDPKAKYTVKAVGGFDREVDFDWDSDTARLVITEEIENTVSKDDEK